jgi:hypothetical integral membrane protein (TIGR02206 family)
MNEHYIMPLLSPEWYRGLAGSVFYLLGALFIFSRLLENPKKQLARMLGTAILGIVVFTQIYFWLLTDMGTLRYSLPLQICDISFIVAGYALLSRHQLAYEWALLIGFPAAVHSILTPEFTHGVSPYLWFEYYFSHTSQILVPMALTYHFAMRPRLGSWKAIFIATNVMLLAVLGINLLVDANYSYLLEKPAVDNPLLIGPWPIYIIGVELAALLHIGLIYALFRRITRFSLKRNLRPTGQQVFAPDNES